MHVYDLLFEAIQFVEKTIKPKDEALWSALLARLDLRHLLLQATNINAIVDDHDARCFYWSQCLRITPELLKSHSLAMTVQHSYSVKIQRRLATTTPPRSIVEMSFVEAIQFLNNLCQNGRDAYKAISYHGPINLQVCLIDAGYLLFHKTDPGGRISSLLCSRGYPSRLFTPDVCFNPSYGAI